MRIVHRRKVKVRRNDDVILSSVYADAGPDPPLVDIDDSTSSTAESVLSDGSGDIPGGDKVGGDATIEYVFDVLVAANPSLDQPLHDGTDISVLTVCYMLIFFMTDNNVSRTGMSQLWDFMVLMLGDDIASNLPPFKKAFKLVTETSGTTRQQLDCCVNDCVIFRDRPAGHDPHGQHRFANLTRCPNCKEPRYNSSDKPRRVFSWLGINRQLAARLWSPGTQPILILSPTAHTRVNTHRVGRGDQVVVQHVG